MLLSGLYEALLDYRIISQPERYKLKGCEHAKALIVVLVGNLDMKDDDQNELFDGLFEDFNNLMLNGRWESRARLKAMLDSQYSFSSLVGAPVLFYLGAFVYSIIDILSHLGNNNSSHAVAFGMWWMMIVHVSIISGCLLASNNPSTMWAIFVKRKWVQKEDGPVSSSTIRKILRSLLSLWCPLYDDTPEPVSLWKRGWNKRAWAKKVLNLTASRFVSQSSIISGPGTLAFLLILIPCGLAFGTSYRTRQIRLRCRSLNVLIYTLSQCLLIMRDLWYMIESDESDDKPPILIRCILWTVWAIAIAGAALSGIGGTLMQLIGVYRNCLCRVKVYNWGQLTTVATVQLATDTELDRTLATSSWKKFGFAAAVFMAFVTYAGWWYQKHLRNKFRDAVDEAWKDRPKLHEGEPDLSHRAQIQTCS